MKHESYTCKNGIPKASERNNDARILAEPGSIENKSHFIYSFGGLRPQGITHALAAGADQRVGGGQNACPGHGVLLDLGHSIDNATDEADEDSRHTGEGDGGIEEDQAGHGDGQLVEGADHRVGGGRGHAHAPGGGIGDEDGRQTGQDHSEDDAVAVGLGEVAGQVGRGPVLDEQSEDDQDRDGQQVVVEHGYNR